jgi:DNA polymerase-3 subunit epsilon
MTLIFDTETTGFPQKVALNHPSQPHIVQIAGLFLGNDRSVKDQFSFLIQPKGYDSIPEAASAVHGITYADCQQYGIPLITAMSVLVNMAKSASRIVGHNLQFDVRQVEIAMARIEKPVPIELVEFGYCTMQTMTNICKLPGKFGNSYKWPKLTEAYKHCFGKDFENAHDALGDVLATRDIYHWCIDNGHIPPSVG